MKHILSKEFLTHNEKLCSKIYEYLTNILTQEDMNILIKQIESIKKRYLYKTNFHGYFHSQKVLLFAYMIGKEIQLSKEEMQIVMDAAVYHDIGRANESEDELHGYYSGCLLENKCNHILESNIYKNKTNIKYLKAICDAHSVGDSRIKDLYETYKYEDENFDFDKFQRLVKVLKDADALDRTRFKKTSDCVLKEKYLRFDYSKTLIHLAEEINYYYVIKEIEEVYPKFNDTYGRKEKVENNQACIHGIGTDFFKLDSILDNGILSAYAQLKQNIKSPRNFYGSNKELWISVVDADMISNDGKAYNKYIKEGISLFCFVPKLKYEGDYLGNQADVNNKKEYEDEKYVFDKIGPDQIYSIIIPKKLGQKKIIELDYLCCASRYETLCEKINYYKEKMRENGFDQIDDKVANKLLSQFRDVMCYYEMKTDVEQKKDLNFYLQSLDHLKRGINLEMRLWHNTYYEFILEKENPTVNDVVKYILSKHENIELEYYDDDTLNETIIKINQKNKKQIIRN